jgi:hypothetical protein
MSEPNGAGHSPGTHPHFTICTQSGSKFDPFAPKKEDLHLEDMVLGLSNCCRYQGQGIFHYSVAQHSVYLARELMRCGLLEEAFCAMLHDGSEGFLPDVPKPIKVRPEMEMYRQAEKATQDLIYQIWSVPGEYPEVKRLDRVIWGNEIPVLFPDGSVKCTHDEFIRDLRVERWTQERAFIEYTMLFHKLRRWTSRKVDGKRTWE